MVTLGFLFEINKLKKFFFSGNNIADIAAHLRNTYNAKLFIISVAKKSEDDLKVVGLNNSEHILYLNQWRKVQSSDINPISKHICKVLFFFNA